MPFSIATSTIVVASQWLAVCFHAISAFKTTLIFSYFNVNTDIAFVRAEFVQVKHARSPPNLALRGLPLRRHSRHQQIVGKDDARNVELSNPHLSFRNTCKSSGKTQTWSMHSRRKYGEVILSALVIPEIGKTGPVESNAGEQIWITFKNGQLKQQQMVQVCRIISMFVLTYEK